MLDEYRIEPISVGQYLDLVYNEEIKIDQAVQRDFCWSKEMMNALIYSALSRKIYIPNFILAEEKRDDGTKQTYVVDAGQRTETLYQFRYCDYKITKNIRNYMIPYKKKKIDENGTVRDEHNNIQWEIEEFDIREKTYDELPKELQDKFNGCPLTTAIYQDCTPEETSELVLLYNNHVGMNVSQKALTYIGKYANEIKRIKDTNRFLMDCTELSEKEKKKGIWERVISESVMAVNYFDDWKKAPKDMCDYLNKNSSINEYKKIETYFNRLIPFADKLENRDVAELFTSKNLFIWMMLFDRFNKLHRSDNEFGEFLDAFVKDLQFEKINGIDWCEINKGTGTKDKGLITRKIEHLETLMIEFLHISSKETKIEMEDLIMDEQSISVIDFVRENVKSEVTDEDIDDYYGMLDGYKKIIKKLSLPTTLLEWENEASVIALVCYSFETDIDLDDWVIDFSKRNPTYINDQKANFIQMKQDLENYINSNEGMVAAG